MIRQVTHSLPNGHSGSSQRLPVVPQNPVIPRWTVLLVEHRDEVIARLAADLAAAGFCVVPAKNSTEAIKRYLRHPTDLLLINADHPAESAWLLAAKLHLTHPTARLWVYMCRPSTYDVTAANFLMIDELIEYGGSICRLTAGILDRLGASADSTAFPRRGELRTPGAPTTSETGSGV